MRGKAKQSWYLKSSLITNGYSLGEARRKSVASSIVAGVIYGHSKFCKYTFAHEEFSYQFFINDLMFIILLDLNNIIIITLLNLDSFVVKLLPN